MSLWRGLELSFIAVIVTLGFTQLVLPLWQGLPIFPAFGKRKKAEDKVAKEREKRVVIEILGEINPTGEGKH